VHSHVVRPIRQRVEQLHRGVHEAPATRGGESRPLVLDDAAADPVAQAQAHLVAADRFADPGVHGLLQFLELEGPPLRFKQPLRMQGLLS
jgi:hypothetical protein